MAEGATGSVAGASFTATQIPERFGRSWAIAGARVTITTTTEHPMRVTDPPVRRTVLDRQKARLEKPDISPSISLYAGRPPALHHSLDITARGARPRVGPEASCATPLAAFATTFQTGVAVRICRRRFPKCGSFSPGTALAARRR